MPVPFIIMPGNAPHLESIKAHFGSDTLLSSITRANVEKYQAELMNKESRRKLPFKPATVNRRMACLRHLFSKAVEWNRSSLHSLPRC